MENRSHALLAGLFLLLLGASAAAVLWWFSGRQEENSHYLVETRDNVTGLNVQAQVRYRGIRVGRVESIRLDPNDARTTLLRISVPRHIPLTRGTVARLGHQGVTGIAHVLLEDDGKDPTPLPPDGKGGARIAMRDSLVQELTDVGGDVLRQTRELLTGMNDLLRPENRQSISRTLANIEASSRHVRETSERLQHALGPDATRRVDSILLQTELTVAQAAPFFAEARGLVARLDTASEKFETTLGNFNLDGMSALTLRLNGLTDEFSSTAQQLNRVLRLLEESPQSLIFGRRAIAPGPGESGFVAPSNGGNAP
ncbi:MAG: MlaD family protein [Candidatus Accumulibacter sp.]|jgi:phospholipid/cholesterol/gamma-HCH transport system substrate-binding protein|nr:MlaD family protein [Accumulibacter sp.]